MFWERMQEGIAIKNKMVIGFELNKDYSQISFCPLDQSTPDTLSLITGLEEYLIPTAISARVISDTPDNTDIVWSVSKDTRDQNQNEGVYVVDDILELVESDTCVVIGSKDLAPVEILEIFLKKCLSLLVAAGRKEEVAGIAFISDSMTQKLMDNIQSCITEIPVFFISKEESFCQYMLHQPAEMWKSDVLLYDMKEDGLEVLEFEVNPSTKPRVCLVNTSHYEELKKSKALLEFEKTKLDQDFKNCVENLCGGRNISVSFLIGDGFSNDWCKESLKEICRHGRAFQGNNLYSKGACLAAKERLVPSIISREYIYLGEDKIRFNIGMQVNSLGKDGYLPILSAGMNWYEAKFRNEFYLSDNNIIDLDITPVDGGAPIKTNLTLDYFHIRGNHTNRVEIFFEMKSVNVLHVEVKDLGFGEIFPQRDNVWKKDIEL